jgi:inorganic pyrophosphatase
MRSSRLTLAPMLLTLTASAFAQEAADAGSEVARSPVEIPGSTSLMRPDPYTLVGEAHFVNDYEARLVDGRVHVVVEIPAGTNAKWEVDKADGLMRWEFKKGAPRIVKYLGYPGNYGMVPRTLLPEELGGDGDPLDVLVLGPATDRGLVVRARIVGVLRLLDDGEQDDKLLAVLDGSPLESVQSLEDLESDYPGILTIVETWFSNYKGPGEIESLGFADAQVAESILSAAITAFEQRQALAGVQPVN